MEAVFQCPKCLATKTIEKPTWKDKTVWLRELPETVPCGVGGCGGRGKLTRDWYINNRAKAASNDSGRRAEEDSRSFIE